MDREEFIKKFKVGDRIRLPRWVDDCYLQILCIGKDKIFILEEDEKTEDVWDIEGSDWRKYEDRKTKPTPVFKYLSFTRALREVQKGSYVMRLPGWRETLSLAVLWGSIRFIEHGNYSNHSFVHIDEILNRSDWEVWDGKVFLGE